MGSSDNSRFSLHSKYQHFSKKTLHMLAIRRGQFMLENQELQLPHKLHYLARRSLTLRVKEQISDTWTLHTPVTTETKMLFQGNLSVLVSHISVLFHNNGKQNKNFGNLLGDFGGLWKIFFFNFWKTEIIFYVFKILHSLKSSAYNFKSGFNLHFVWRSFVLITQKSSAISTQNTTTSIKYT